eukprot:CAMPEP_0115076334 /NCGR_PEP_ID=MMETSP0227-20121206/16373_1 /TAXON_ID=89957 /ORGANISM="Polarella glacialis, Strain CCMP 1383" /LENGTH=128 /DNA_ID=CAMNT_0002463471 /DNA_START=127 /DNA_END=510 /DNA_ORIENTATION=+
MTETQQQQETQQQPQQQPLSLAQQDSLGHHHLHKLFVINLTVTIDVSLTDHFIHLLVSQLLAQIRHDVTKLCCADEAVAVAIEDLEGLDELLFGVRVLHLPGHQREELREVDGSVAIGVHLVDHVLKL